MKMVTIRTIMPVRLFPILRMILALVIVLGIDWRNNVRVAHAQHEEPVSALLDPYWERRAEVVQNRGRAKGGAVELVGLIGVIPNDPFVVYLPLGLRAAYHLSNRWAVEGSFTYNLSLDTELKRDLEQSGASLAAVISARQLWRGGLCALWSPVYGKLALGRGVLTFDGYLLGGAGVISIAEERLRGLSAAVGPDFSLGVGLRAFLGSRGVLRLEYRQYLFVHPTDPSGGAGVGLAAEVSLNGGFLLGARH